MTENALHVCITLRQLLISICDASSTKRKTTIIFLLDYQKMSLARQSRLIKNFEEIEFIFINESELINEFFPIKIKIPKIVKRNFSINQCRLYFGCSSWTPKILKNRVYNTAYIYHSGPFTSKAIRNVSQNIILREDGLSNYVVQPLHPLKAIARVFFGLSAFGQVWGEERWIAALEVELPDLLPKRVRNKATKLTMSSLLNTLDDTRKALLIDSFELDSLARLSARKSCLILTQPIDDFGACSTEEKIAIYYKIVQKFIAQNYDVFLKFHPKEQEYEIPDTHIIPKDFPVELLEYVLNEKFHYCVALCSSSLNSEEHSLAINQKQIIPLERFSPKYFKEWNGLVEALKIED